MTAEELLAIVAAVIWSGVVANPETDGMSFHEAVSDAEELIDIVRRRKLPQ